MKSKPISFAGAILIALLFHVPTQAQTFGTKASAVWISDCNQSNYYNTSGNAIDLIGPSGNTFSNNNFGVHTQNSGTLILRGAQVKTFKNPATSNVCSVRMYYRVYLQSGVPGAFTPIDLPFLEDCDVPLSQFPSGGPCQPGDQKWERVIADGVTTPYAPVNLTNHAPGNYVLEVYYDVTGSSSGTSLCDETVTLDNGGSYYKAFFSLQSPTLSSTNPSSCFGTEGSITIGGLVAGASYQLSYSDDGTTVGPASYTANASGQIIITGLNAGFYSSFSLTINGCTTNLFVGVILSNPIFVPTFSNIPAFCAGTTAPVLPGTSNNSLSGTWSPAVVDNQNSGAYTFTPSGGQCAVSVTINITVIPRTTPSFPFGTSASFCSGASVPTLPNTSTNGINGTWSPSVIDNMNSGTYTFTPNAGQCANSTTLTVTINPNITPTFPFGTSASFCAGASVPTLPNTSDNGITGTWSPATVDNQNSGTYTFTPDAGQCALTTSYSVTISPNVTPTFPFGTSASFCAGASVPTLPNTSDNGITGTWSPATVDNQNSGTYTFTPDAGQCALTASYSVTINPNITPTFSFGTSASFCAGASVPALPNTSDNGITGTWSPATVDNQNSGTYTFTPDAGQCALTASYSVIINPNITPTFPFGTSASFCAGASVPALPNTSDNGITGTWSPANIDNQNSGTYTFTPTAGQCATTATLTVTINPILTPVFPFGTSASFCAGASVPTLPNTSDNGITGTWSPATVDNQNSGTYTFTPDAGQCALTASYSVTINPNITPTFSFGTSASFCAGASVPTLPNTSDNGITGTWSPATVDNQNSGTYTFTPDSGQCALTASYSVTINPNITPTFSFGTSASFCAGASVPSLPNTSDNGITGTWSPATVDNQNSGTYIFTPTAGQCALTASYSVTINPNITPTFPFGTSASFCAGASVPSLPNTSDNGITGTWSPATVDNQNSGTYTFTPDAGQCATTATLTVTINPNITPTFPFGTSASFCAGASVPTLPNTSDNGITGTWSPAIIDNQNSGTYTFTPTAGQCATTTTLTVTINPILTPIFSFGTSASFCAGASVPALPNTSDNGISGTWSPATIDNQNSGTYTFTPDAGQCGTATSLSVTINPNAIPVFSFGPSLSICAGGAVPALPNISDNSINGSWSPAIVSNQTSGTYIFTGNAGQCVTPYTFTVTVNPIVTPSFSFGNFQSVCIGSAVPNLPTVSDNGISGTWSPAVADNQVSGTYVFTPTPGQCANSTQFTLEINPVPSVTVRGDTTVYDGDLLPVYNWMGTPGSVINWVNSNTDIGLPASGTGNLPSFTAINKGDNPISGTVIITPAINGCTGLAQSYKITVLPLDKDVFVPNVFSPNDDGKNDILYVYGNYIDKVDMHIYNQWGQEVATIKNKSQGWDGRHKGNPQPVGVYVYVLKAELSGGRTVQLKGSITLVR